MICGYHGHRRAHSISVFVSELTPEELSLADNIRCKIFNPIELTADIVAAFVANNALPIADLPSLIQSVHAALANSQAGR